MYQKGVSIKSPLSIVVEHSERDALEFRQEALTLSISLNCPL